MFGLHATGVNPDATEKSFYSKHVPSGMLDPTGIKTDDISLKQRGLEDADLKKLPPIAIADGKLIDGQGRVKLAQQTGQKIRYVDLSGLVDPEKTGSISDLPKRKKDNG